MTLNQLEYALAVSQYGSFKLAAEKLYLTQPALSMQIQKLEQELGIRIFDRTQSPVTITDDGAKFLERAREIVTATRQLYDFSVNLNQDFDGQVKLGIIPTLAPYLVPWFVEPLLKAFPQFRLDIHELITEKVIQGVLSGELDAGIISTPVSVSGLNVMPLFYEKFYIYTSEKSMYGHDAIDLRNIEYSNLWLLEEGNCFRDQINNFCDLNKIRKNKQLVYRSHSIDALIRLVDAKGGITILPELSTLSLSQEQEENIREISGKPKAREISIIKSRFRGKERFIAKITEYIRTNIPKTMLSSEGLEIVDPEIQVSLRP